MSDNYRVEVNFDTAWSNTRKRLMRQERRPSVTGASQILGPGAGPFAILINDWNAEEATFTGIFYSEPGAVNGPDDLLSLAGTYYWMGETFGAESEDGERYGFQRLTRYRLVGDGGGSWDEYRRRYYPQGDLFAYTTWTAV